MAYLSRMRIPGAQAAIIDFNRNVMLHEVPHFARHYRMMRLRVPTLHLNGACDPLSEGVPDSYRDTPTICGWNGSRTAVTSCRRSGRSGRPTGC